MAVIIAIDYGMLISIVIIMMAYCIFYVNTYCTIDYSHHVFTIISQSFRTNIHWLWHLRYLNILTIKNKK